MTLKEFSDTLNDIMTRHGPDAMVRMVVKAGDSGQQYEVIEVLSAEGLHGPMVLVMAGANTATMDWPGPDYMP